ncbi:MAG: TlpA disulfide reductase family protein [Planctomycetota bacterium]
MRFFPHITAATLIVAASCISGTVSAAEPEAGDPPVLTIGSPAPSLEIEHWVQDGNGKLEPVTTFKEGTVYIVEFWATWCGPCRSSMPHLAETQVKYGDKVRLVSVSDEPLKTVTDFLKKKTELPSGEEVTYDELTSVYSLTCDPDRSVSKDYMRAAGRNGIPCAFLVGKKGIVEWIGHPMSMDNVLEEVLADKWDRAKFAEEFKREQEMSLIQGRVFAAFQEGDFEKAVKMIDEVLKDVSDPRMKAQFAGMRKQALILSGVVTDEMKAELEEQLQLAAKTKKAQDFWQAASRIGQATQAGAKIPELVASAIKVGKEMLTVGEDRENTMTNAMMSDLYTAVDDKPAAIAALKSALETSQPGRMKAMLTQQLASLEGPAEKAPAATKADDKSDDE